MMKKIASITGVLAISLAAQAQTMLWPIAGKSAGEDILSQPQNYIGEELNFDGLFIGAESGAIVLCPAEGTIIYVGTAYYRSLTYSLSSGSREKQSLKEQVLAAREQDGTQYTGFMSLRLADGNKVHLHGFLSDKAFKTGQKLSRGDTLGVVDYSYKAFRKPSLCLSVSKRDNTAADPMTPFGLNTTFIEPKALTREDPLPAEKVREDLDVLKEAVCELYPSLEDRMGESAFRAYMDSLKSSVFTPVGVSDGFRMMLRDILHQIPDSHIGLLPDPIQTASQKSWQPGEFLMFCNDTVRILFTVPEFKQYEGKVVSRINGAPSFEYARKAYKFLYTYDAGVKSTPEEEIVLLGAWGRLMNLGAGKDRAHELELEDGSTVYIPFYERPRFQITDTYKRMVKWHNLNRMERDDDVFHTRVLNDSTAYLGIKTFEMLTGQVEQVRAFLDTLRAPNLIVDVRNNAGGHSEVLMNLLSCLANEPMDKQKGGYARVNKAGNFASLAHSLNYAADSEIFPDYEPGENGFYLRDTLETCSVVLPDAQVHYDGKVYILTNGSSFSAATLFPAVLVRNRRGVSVGRETGTGYHYMTALKFADIQLPNSLQTIHIPMVQLVFDKTVCDRFPEGRGLLPDYPLPLTYDEVVSGADGHTDVMLEHALSLIAEGKYLSDVDPFALVDKEVSASSGISQIITGAVALIVAILLASFLVSKRKKGNSNLSA